MRTKPVTAGLALILILSAPVWAKKGSSPGTTVNIAVTNLKSEEGVTPSMASMMSDILRTELYKTGSFTVMNREDMDAILKEIKFQQSGACDQTSCIVEMGQALGVDRMVAGTLGVIGDNYVINAKLINIATAKNEILVTEYQSRKDTEGPQATFRRIALKLAGLEASIEAPIRRKSAKDFPSRGLFFSVSGGMHHINFKGDTFHSGYAGDGYQAYRTDSFGLHVGAGYRFLPNFSVKAMATFCSGDVVVSSNGASIDGDLLAKVSRTNFVGTVAYTPMTGAVRAYLAPGVGLANVHVVLEPGAAEGLRPSSNLDFVLQAGVEYLLNRHIGVFAEFNGFAQAETGMNIIGGGLNFLL